jgi:hypothetical protein
MWTSRLATTFWEELLQQLLQRPPVPSRLSTFGEEVRKVMLEKARQGHWLTVVPVGYVNNAATHRIELDPDRAPIIVRLWSNSGRRARFTPLDGTLPSLNVALCVCSPALAATKRQEKGNGHA